jgi:hypothetical protein
MHDGIQGASMHLCRRSAVGWDIRQSGSSALQCGRGRESHLGARDKRRYRLRLGKPAFPLVSVRQGTSLSMTYRMAIVSAGLPVVAGDPGLVWSGSAVVADQVVSLLA